MVGDAGVLLGFIPTFVRPAVHQEIVLALIIIITLGGVAQWLAWRLGLPSILLLLTFGFIAGPVAGWVNPDRLFGDLLLPLVSLSVAVILFEGALNLDFSELRTVGSIVRNLVSVGALITWLVAAAAGRFFVGLDWGLAILLGGLLVVTGPTVVLPLLREIRPSGPVRSILKWEGIVIDPIGALLAVLTFEVLVGAGLEHAPRVVAVSLLGTVSSGIVFGLLPALVLILALQRYWIPDYLQSALTLALVVVSFGLANRVQGESGLLAVTVMGIALANQRRASIRSILAFKENLQVVLLAALFVLLSARLRLDDLTDIGVGAVAFVTALILVARPLGVLVSTLGSSLPTRGRLFLMCMAPRGIVAAAVASVFALALEERGYAQARLLTPVTFATIIGTVLFYGLAARPAARRLRLADANPQGLLIVSAGKAGRAIAAALQALGFRVLLVDTNRANIAAARLAGLSAYFGSILAEPALEEIDLAGIGRLLALTTSDEVNLLAVQRFTHDFGRAEVYQSPPVGGEQARSQFDRHLHGRWAFSADLTAATLEGLFEHGAVIKATKLSAEFNFQAFGEHYGTSAVPLFVAAENSRLTVLATDTRVEPRPGQTLIALILPDKAAAPSGAGTAP